MLDSLYYVFFSNQCIIEKNSKELLSLEQLMMCYQLLFKTAPGSLVLIDEPEASQQESWQKVLAAELQKIAETGELINRVKIWQQRAIKKEHPFF